MSLEQSMQVSMATLRAATNRHYHMDRVSGDILTTQYPYYNQQKRRRRGSYNHSKQATCSKQTAGSLEAKHIQLSPTNLVTLKSH